VKTFIPLRASSCLYGENKLIEEISLSPQFANMFRQIGFIQKMMNKQTNDTFSIVDVQMFQDSIVTGRTFNIINIPNIDNKAKSKQIFKFNHC
jgi:hypothetical protein